jgi:DMSO/TMAO reductase YedYZ molybdopterin-dependent catalytic subunit
LYALALYSSGADSAVLRVEGAAGRDGVAKPALSLSLEDLTAMPHVAARVRTRDGTERTYEGVLLSKVLERAGQPLGEDLRGSLLTRYVLVVAHDGYRVLFSLPEVDPAFCDARIIVAYKVDGKPLPDREGPLRFVIPAEKSEPRWIRMVERIEIAATPHPIR